MTCSQPIESACKSLESKRQFPAFYAVPTAHLLYSCADQSHFIRDIQEVTGFTPDALHSGLLREEAFSVYRAWAMLWGAEWSRSSGAGGRA